MSTEDLLYLNDNIALMSATLELHARSCAGATDEPTAAQLVSLIETLDQRVAAREASNPDLAALVLARRLNLCAPEMQVIWLLSAVALSSDARELVVRWGRTSAPDPNLEAIRSLLFGTQASLESLEVLAPTGTLRALGLIERSDGGGADVHESRRTWSVSRRALEWLHGRRDVSPTVASACGGDASVEADRLVLDSTTRESIARLLRTPRHEAVVVTGIPGSGRASVIRSLAREAGRRALVIDVGSLCRGRDVEARARDLALECRLIDASPVLDGVDAANEQDAQDLVRTLGALVSEPILATSGLRVPKLDWGRPVVTVEMPAPTSEQRAKLWLDSLGCGTETDGQNLAALYPLAPGLIVRAADVAKSRAGDRPMGPQDVRAGIRAVVDDGLGQYAKRVTVTQTWDDVVLPREQIDPIIELMARVRGRSKVYEQWGFARKVGKGLGVSALFSGPPGTGKTMVAGLIANDLGIDLYQVDMAKVVSKFIGETEKNLAGLFDAAEAGHAILLFDEADALFGKRTDVKSSNDRYANFETNYLLQRLESFTGICLLTSNHESHIDPAFQRRLSLHLRFELPCAEERTTLWRATLPAAAPVEPDVDFVALGQRFAMSGGYIRNAALRAAFLAADTGSTISAKHLEYAARVEYEGMGKLAA